MTPREIRYIAAYNDGRTACVAAGTSSGLRDQFQRCDADAAYRAGYEWACWDYDDANGLPLIALRLGAG